MESSVFLLLLHLFETCISTYQLLLFFFIFNCIYNYSQEMPFKYRRSQFSRQLSARRHFGRPDGVLISKRMCILACLAGYRTYLKPPTHQDRHCRHADQHTSTMSNIAQEDFVEGLLPLWNPEGLVINVQRSLDVNPMSNTDVLDVLRGLDALSEEEPFMQD